MHAFFVQFSGILTGVFLFVLLMFLHEMGHFLTGLFLGFKIEEFSIFLGPVLFSFEYKGIKFSLKAIPLGASVKFAGEYNETRAETQEQTEGDFHQMPAWKRFLVVFHGPLVNLLSGFLAFALLFVHLGYNVQEIEKPSPHSVAGKAALQEGDRILSISGESIHHSLDIASLQLFKKIRENPLVFVYLRKEQGQWVKKETMLAWEEKESYRLGLVLEKEAFKGGNYLKISKISEKRKAEIPLKEGDILRSINGIEATEENRLSILESLAKESAEVKLLRHGAEKTEELVFQVPLEKTTTLLPLGIQLKKEKTFFGAFISAFHYSISVVKMTFRSIYAMLTGELSAAESLSGPVGVVHAISQVSIASSTWAERLQSLTQMFALLSLSIGIMNLLPIPPLDGFHLVLTTLEILRRGKKVSTVWVERITLVGLLLLLAMFLFGFYFDLLRLFN